MIPQTFHIEVYGCQMNKLDGQLAADRLRAMGLREGEGPREADVVLFVTCSVRQHAEDRVYSNAGKLKHRKARHPEMIIGILGCMAEKDRDGIFRRLPHVDFICGPGQLDRLEDLIRDAAARTEAVHLAALDAPRVERTAGEVDDHLESFELGRLTPVGEHPFHAYVRAMRGCDNFCAYCIVPYVRGPEASRPPAAILDEVRRLVAAGVRHVTLLGQSIGSYSREEDGRTWGLADLVRAAAGVEGLVRLDFVTTHPKNLSDAIIDSLAAGPPVAPYLHVPAQSGSDRVLRAMNRGYTIDEYRRRVARARQRVPDLSVASDFIVGFPGETDADFEATVRLVREMDFSQVFAFKYSVRPGTAAARLDDDVPEDVKKDRLARLLEVWSESALRSKQGLVGRTVECLVTGPSPKPHLDGMAAEQGGDRLQLSSRSPGHQIVLFEGSSDLIGRMVPVRITRFSPITLFGEAAGD
ncbi:MAG: tRNA (N6-isopentenyl adenosine(37)-C2)-methylthiotransferase MiaB [Planctomycetes bacterium]|nr:tRNA (N6-isopentenyl adenosine(37)-C2)-methylthiotransferase MiaB [Planctomycetota bacterium]